MSHKLRPARTQSLCLASNTNTESLPCVQHEHWVFALRPTRTLSLCLASTTNTESLPCVQHEHWVFALRPTRTLSLCLASNTNTESLPFVHHEHWVFALRPTRTLSLCLASNTNTESLPFVHHEHWVFALRPTRTLSLCLASTTNTESLPCVQHEHWVFALRPPRTLSLCLSSTTNTESLPCVQHEHWIFALRPPRTLSLCLASTLPSTLRCWSCRCCHHGGRWMSSTTTASTATASTMTTLPSTLRCGWTCCRWCHPGGRCCRHDDRCRYLWWLRAYLVIGAFSTKLPDLLVEIGLSLHWQSLGRYDRWQASWARALAKGEPLCSTARELPHLHDTRSLGGYRKAVEQQEAYNRLVGIVKECRPVVARHNDLAILRADALREVADRGRLACCLDVGLWWKERPTRHPLQQAETPIRGKLGVSGHHEADAGKLVQTSRDTRHQVAHHDVVLILACTVVCMQLQVVLADSIGFQEVVQKRYHHVGPLPRWRCLVYQVVYLPWNAFCMNPEQLHLARRLEEDRSWLHGIGRVVQLLGEVETVMEGGRWVIASAQFADAMLLGECLRVGTRCLVGGPLCGRLSKVLILSEEGRRLHSLGDVDGSQDVWVVPLAHPTQVGLRLADHNVWNELMPEQPEWRQLNNTLASRWRRRILSPQLRFCQCLCTMRNTVLWDIPSRVPTARNCSPLLPAPMLGCTSRHQLHGEVASLTPLK